MNVFKKRKILVTHNETFHADDLFATAVLSILFDGNIKIIRTRNTEIISKADIVYDVGGVYNPETNRFDHHQKEGAGKRENGIPYSSFGVIWKKFGEQICGDLEVASYLDTKIVQPIDATDNGIDICTPAYGDLKDYSASSIFKAFSPTWKEKETDMDRIFIKEVNEIIPLLKREIKVAKDFVEGKKIIIDTYKKTKDKRIIILDRHFNRYLIQSVLPTFPEPIFFIYNRPEKEQWNIEAVREDLSTHKSRKYLPEEWRGVLDIEKLRSVTMVKDIIFCHRDGFVAVTKSKESAIALAEKALIA